MKTIPSMIAALALVMSFFGTVLGEDDEPYGRACISIVAPGSPEHEEVFTASASDGLGKKIRIYTDASIKSTVVVVALRKDGKLVAGWRPEITELAEDFEEVLLPKAPATWDWSLQAAFDFYIVFLPNGSADQEDFKNLVLAMQNPRVDDRLLNMQTNKLRELISRISSASEKENRIVAVNPEVGGVFRGSAFPWRQFAQKVNFSAGKPGVLVFPSAGANGLKAAPAASQ